MVYLRKILVTTDLSEFSLAALEHAASFGLLYGSSLYCLHVLDAIPPLFALRGRETDGRSLREKAEETALKSLQEFVAGNINPETRLTLTVRSGEPAHTICKFAREEGMDMIVMATHGRTGLKHVVMGSVAEKVVRLADVPVLTVKPHPVREKILKNEEFENEQHAR